MKAFKINHSKTFISPIRRRGSTRERFSLARLFNIKFYEDLQNDVVNNEIAPRKFIRTLIDVARTKLKITIAPVTSLKDSYMLYSFNEDAVNEGYSLGLPLSSRTGKIHKNMAKTFLKETQNMFNEAFNPKILARFVALLNKGYDVKSILSFYKENISQTSNLTQDALENFLEGKDNQEKIDTLQFLRYKLMSEKNTIQASEQIDKYIEKYNKFKYEHAENHYDITKYQFDTKFELLNSKLLDIINKNRENA